MLFGAAGFAEYLRGAAVDNKKLSAFSIIWGDIISFIKQLFLINYVLKLALYL